MQVLGFTEGQFWATMLLLARLGSLFAFMPPYAHPFVSKRIKAAIILVMTVSLAYNGLAGSVPPPPGIIEMTLMVAREAAIGLMLGLTIQVLFLSVLFGGQIIGSEMGLNAAHLLDPLFKTSVSEIAYIYYYAALLVFLAVGGDRLTIESFADNLHRLPLGQIHLSGSAVKALVFWTGEIFTTGFSLAAPVLASLFASTMLLGVLARSVPQINMLMMGYSLKMSVGYVVVAVTMPMWIDAFLRFMAKAMESMQGMVHLIGGG